MMMFVERSPTVQKEDGWIKKATFELFTTSHSDSWHGNHRDVLVMVFDSLCLSD